MDWIPCESRVRINEGSEKNRGLSRTPFRKNVFLTKPVRTSKQRERRRWRRRRRRCRRMPSASERLRNRRRDGNMQPGKTRWHANVVVVVVVGAETRLSPYREFKRRLESRDSARQSRIISRVRDIPRRPGAERCFRVEECTEVLSSQRSHSYARVIGECRSRSKNTREKYGGIHGGEGGARAR